jgi:pyrroline-5-carboxylate reductase
MTIGSRIGFIGGGNIAEALIRGLLQSGTVGNDAVRASDPSDVRREQLGRAHAIGAHADNREVAAWAEVLVLAVKPQAMAAALASLAGFEALVITVAAGVPTTTIEAALPARVVRAMPNTPALVGAGATAIAKGSRATDADLELAAALFASVGRVVRVSESALDAVTGLSGSGPAYVMVLIEALADGGVAMGLPRDVALTLAAQTVYGSAKLQLDTGEHPAALKDRVASPGGTTIAGLSRLEAEGFRGAVIAAVEAATVRAHELGNSSLGAPRTTKV